MTNRKYKPGAEPRNKPKSKQPDFLVGTSYTQGKGTFFYLRPSTPRAKVLLQALGLLMPLEELGRETVCQYLGSCAERSLEDYGEKPKIEMQRGVTASDKSYFREKLNAAPA